MELSIIKEPDLVVALDIGSTYSGYAWQWRTDFEFNRSNIEFNTNWGCGSLQLHKTLTCILLDKNENIDSFGHKAEKRYCQQCDELDGNIEKIVQKWYFFKTFKVTLYQKGFTEGMDVEDRLGQLLPLKTVMSKFIEALKSHFIESLKGKYKEDDTLWVLTVPAIWSEDAKRFMRIAAEKCIKRKHLLLANEPESAALYCIHLPLEQRQRMNKFGEKGDKFVVVDLGGGTVDIMAIEVLENGNVKEIVQGSGDRIGGQDVNNAFFQCCKDIFEGEAWHMISSRNVEDIMQMEMDFENKKVSIGSTDSRDEEIRLNVPYSMFEMINEGKVKIRKCANREQFFRVDKHNFKFNSKLIREVLFDETLSIVLDSIKRVLSDNELKDLKHVVIVGGFSESKIVVEKIKFALKKDFSQIEVVVPTSPSRAVLMGAVLYGHNPLIFNSRISRATYGVETHEEFDPTKHDVLKKRKNEEDGKDYCKDIFSIHVKKGQSVSITERQPSLAYKPFSKNQTQLCVRVFSTDLENPTYITDNECREIGNINIDIPDTTNGANRCIKVEMIYGGTELAVIATNEETGQEYVSTYDIFLPPATKSEDILLPPATKSREFCAIC